MSESVNVTTTLHIHTCDNGHLYAVPHWTSGFDHGCPMCLKREKYDLCAELATTRANLRRQNHVIQGLRGALKRKAKP